MLQRSQGLTVAPESTVPCREYVMYWSQSKLVKVCKAIKVFLPQQTTLFYLPLSHIQLWRVRVISGFQLCVIEPCFASGPCSFIRVLVDGAVLGAEVTLLWLSWCPDITTQKRKRGYFMLKHTTSCTVATCSNIESICKAHKPAITILHVTFESTSLQVFQTEIPTMSMALRQNWSHHPLQSPVAWWTI